MNNVSVLRISNIVVLVATLIVNFLSQSGPVFGVQIFPYTVAELAESRALFFLPAGYVFAIWGIIYLGLGAFVVFQSRPSQRDNAIHSQIGWWFVVSSFGNMAWLVLFLNDLVAVSTIAMLVIVVSLLAIYLRLGIGKTEVSNGVRWCVHVPFSIYLGWITVATVANISTMLYVWGSVTSFLGLSSDVWAVVMMAIACVIAGAMLFFRGDVAFALVVVWALVGIYVRPFDTEVYSLVSALNIGLVNTAAIGLAVVVGVLSVAQPIVSRVRR